MRDNGIKLQRLIENLLGFSAWQSNSTGLDVTRVPAAARGAAGAGESAADAGVAARAARRAHRGLTLAADRGKIRLILENLLSNAIKYSPRGGIIYLRAVGCASS